MGIHWWAFTTTAPLGEVIAAVSRYVVLYHRENPETLFRSPGHGNRGYQHVLIGWLGTRISYSDGREDIYVEVPGDGCEFCGSASLLQMLGVLPCRMRRIDFAIDGLLGPDGKRLCPGWVFETLTRRPESVRTAANLSSRESVVYTRNVENQTCYLGSAQSERRVRFYDKRGPTRCEIQVRGDRAEGLGEKLRCMPPGDLPAFGLGVIRDFVDFIEPGDPSQIEGQERWKGECELASWWAAMVGRVARIKLTIARPEPHIERAWKWAKQAWAATYFTFIKASGGDVSFLDVLMEEGEKRYNARHRQIVETAGGEGGWVAPSPEIPI